MESSRARPTFRTSSNDAVAFGRDWHNGQLDAPRKIRIDVNLFGNRQQCKSGAAIENVGFAAIEIARLKIRRLHPPAAIAVFAGFRGQGGHRCRIRGRQKKQRTQTPQGRARALEDIGGIRLKNFEKIKPIEKQFVDRFAICIARGRLRRRADRYATRYPRLLYRIGPQAHAASACCRELTRLAPRFCCKSPPDQGPVFVQDQMAVRAQDSREPKRVHTYAAACLDNHCAGPKQSGEQVLLRLQELAIERYRSGNLIRFRNVLDNAIARFRDAGYPVRRARRIVASVACRCTADAENVPCDAARAVTPVQASSHSQPSVPMQP